MGLEQKMRNTIFIAVTAVSFITTYIAAAFNIALPAIGRDLAMDSSQLPWIAGVFSLTMAVLLVPFGRIADLYGKKKVFITGIAVLMVFSVLVALADGKWWILINSIIGGIGTAMCFSNVAAILSESFPVSDRGRILGSNVAVAYVGASGGPFLGGLITQYLGWRAVFWTMLPVLAIGFFLAWRSMPAGQPKKEVKFDGGGTMLYVLGLALVILGISSLTESYGPWMIAGGAATLAIFVWFERRLKNPLIHLEVFSNRVFSLSNLASLIHYGTTYATALLLSMYLQDHGIKGLTASLAGLVLLAQPLMQIIFSPIAGRLSDRLEPRWLASSGMAVTALCLFALSRVQVDTGLTVIILILLVMGTGFSFFVAPNNNAIMSSLSAEKYGLASGVMATGRILGMSLSLATTTVILNHTVTGGGGASLGFMNGFHYCFLAFSLLAIIGIAASLSRGRPAVTIDEKV